MRNDCCWCVPVFVVLFLSCVSLIFSLSFLVLFFFAVCVVAARVRRHQHQRVCCIRREQTAEEKDQTSLLFALCTQHNHRNYVAPIFPAFPQFSTVKWCWHRVVSRRLIGPHGVVSWLRSCICCCLPLGKHSQCDFCSEELTSACHRNKVQSLRDWGNI